MAVKFVNPDDTSDPVPSGVHFSKSLASMVLGLVRPFRKWLFLILIAMLIETIMSLAAPWPLKIIIDNVIGDHKLPHWLSWMQNTALGENALALAAVAAISVVIIALIGSIAGYVNSYFTESVAQHVANDLRRRMYHHLQRLSLSYYDSHQVGKVLSTITSDVSTIQDFASSSLLSILVDALTIIGMLCLMFYLNWDFALIAVGVTPFLLLFIARFKKAVKKATRQVRLYQSNMIVVLQQGLESMRAVNAFGRQDYEEDRLKKVSQETMNAALRARRLKSLLVPVVTVIVSMCTALVLWRGAGLSLKGIMTVGSLTVFLSYLNKFFNPVQDLAKLTNTIAQATVALERIQTILETDTIIPQKPNAIVPKNPKGHIVFDHVAFYYNPESPVLHDLCLTIQPGQRVGICGPTGGGKSTIASLIPRFYDPTAGRVLIDGIDIRDYNLDGLRNQIGFVLQDTVLFYGTIRENIAYGRPSATEEELVAAAKLANADEFIAKMPHGYDTLVGERGMTLSGGQRQRIGIARAVVRNSPILILDEPTAALDTESEKIVMDALEKLMEGRTVLTIAHRLSTISDSDKIIVVKDGIVAEEGRHEELIEKNGIYAELYHVQAREDKSITENGHHQKKEDS
ncbi:ABC transporter ATP-binding protein [Flavihumibacter profundi]|jgi:ABC-type multidrug transport system fused ATPase/permease subunit|uniref:ABC transporter ATP-binding protein n=1 Tax=Flavihumibacter profundi TaxID=2716883 RepID=UPI001CC5693B|nr:ABC transporter ATP-binding protein [Flavihumibacter profundi]MBZ5859544.1 ABC transporter ATP-binding protein/permease [Flavihumibacter profundi]